VLSLFLYLIYLFSSDIILTKQTTKNTHYIINHAKRFRLDRNSFCVLQQTRFNDVLLQAAQRAVIIQLSPQTE